MGTASKQSNNRNVAPLREAQHNISPPKKKPPSLEPGISCSEKRTKAWEKPSFNKSWQQKNYPNYIHPSIHHRKIFGFSACNQLSSTFNLETLDMNVTLKIPSPLNSMQNKGRPLTTHCHQHPRLPPATSVCPPGPADTSFPQLSRYPSRSWSQIFQRKMLQSTRSHGVF